jgi:hypothetical protein
LDGFTAAHTVHTFLSKRGDDVCHWFWQHNKNPPAFGKDGVVLHVDPSCSVVGTGSFYSADGAATRMVASLDVAVFDEILFFDIFPTREMMQALRSLGAIQRVKIFDHHDGVRHRDAKAPDAPSLLEVATEMGFSVVMSDDNSGAGLAHAYAYPQEEADLFTVLVEDGDLWRFKHEKTKALRLMLEVTEKTFPDWTAARDRVNSDPPMLDRWSECLDYRDRIVKKLADQAIWTRFADHLVPFVNSPVWQSEIGNFLCKKYPSAPFALVYCTGGPDHNTYVSLRANGNVHVGLLAQKFGGGGHANAAGCMLTADQWRYTVAG